MTNNRDLPDWCYTYVHSANDIGIVRRFENGYWPVDDRSIPNPVDRNDGVKLADKLNAEIGVTKAQAAAMSHGSVFGWDLPVANPANYDENGRLIKNT